MQWVRCGGERFSKAGPDGEQRQRFRCQTCQARQTARTSSPFAGYRFPDAIIALAVCWYLQYRLPYANVAELLAERGVFVDASTVFDWVQRFAPLYQEAARPHRKPVRGSWSIDETYVKVAGVTRRPRTGPRSTRQRCRPCCRRRSTSPASWSGRRSSGIISS
jgi:transposase-like protein